LQILDLANTQITGIPDYLGQLSNLWLLDLSFNHITAIPDSVARLSRLRFLHLWRDQITAIPDSLGQLSNLEGLYLSGNRITTIPDSLAQLSNLQRLDLSNNQITAIPDSLARLSNLLSLILSGNQITAIPDSVAQLSSLQNLNLGNNQITAVPDSFAKLEQLTELFLHGNPGLGIPDEILGPTYREVHGSPPVSPKPPKEILSYYFSQHAGSRPLNEAKLILVGQGGAGKTSLVNALTTGKFDSTEKTTEGIKISDWPCTLSGDDKVTLHIWDFGGQEMMHATHLFFLTARSLYLLVLNRRHGGSDREADYWFRLIRAFGGKNAPVIVVLNKQKSEPFDVNRGGWLEKYAENIRGFVGTDCMDAKTIDRLKERIQEHLRDLKDLKAGFPARWFAIKKELTGMGAQYVTFEDYRAICRKHGEGDVEKQTSLAGFLHDLGIALNYRNDPRLRFAYVLKPEWVTEGIYGLLHAFVTTKGLFTSAEAERALAGKGYTTEAADFIMGLMEQFELSFPLGDYQKRTLIPQLLDDQQPEMARDFKPAECLNFGYQYPIVTEGLLPRFIVRTHHLSEAATRWKSGVILRDPNGCRGLVRTDSGEGQVRIHIDGPEGSRRELLAIIRHNFNAIHADYQFQPRELVYPKGAPDKFVFLDEVEAFQSSGMPAMPIALPNGTVVMHPFASLVEPAPPNPLRVFLSYAHEDEEHVKQLLKDLKLMERNGLIRVWHDRALTAGEKWEERILQELNLADVIVCQLSRDFLASDFCVLRELERAIERKTAGEAELIAYVLKECGWKEVEKLEQFQILPKGAKPLAKWGDTDAYWRAVAEGIQAAVKKLQETRPLRDLRARAGGV